MGRDLQLDEEDIQEEISRHEMEQAKLTLLAEADEELAGIDEWVLMWGR